MPKQSKQILNFLQTDEIFIGLMISDGHLRKVETKKQNSMFMLTQSEKNKELIHKTLSHLQDLGINCHVYTRLVNKKYWIHQLQTKKTDFFTELRKIWYPNDIKIIPNDLKITAKTLAYIFMGDGSSNWKRENIDTQIRLHLEGFELQDIKKLQQIVSKKFNINFNFEKRKNNNFRLCLCKSIEVNRFLNLIEPYILNSFKYKIKKPIITSRKIANNRPERKMELSMKNKLYWSNKKYATI